jgi:YbgC/YbaW family acyl-CoA thioester hydrolase
MNMSGAFTKPVTIRFEHTDAEGIMFFGNIYRIVHDVYEDFAKHLGFEYKEWFQNAKWGAPLRKSECEYFAPLRPGHTYDVEVSIPTIGESSFTSRYVVTSNGKQHAVVNLVHAFVDRAARTKTAIPSEIRGRLQAYQSESGLPK